MREIVEAVMLRLKEQVPELRWIDINLGQMNTETPPVDYPCALVDVGGINYQGLTKTTSRGTVRVEVELFFVVRTPTNMSAPISMRETAFDTFDIVKKVDFALHGLETDEFYPMKRVSVGRNKQYYPRSFILTYECKTDIGN